MTRTRINELLDHVMSVLKLRKDSALAIEMGVDASLISKFRNERTKLSMRCQIWIHEKTGMSFPQIREYLKGE